MPKAKLFINRQCKRQYCVSQCDYKTFLSQNIFNDYTVNIYLTTDHKCRPPGVLFLNAGSSTRYLFSVQFPFLSAFRVCLTERELPTSDSSIRNFR